MDLRDYLSMMRARKLAMGMFVVGAVVLAALVTLSSPKVYAATSSAMVIVTGTSSPVEQSMADTLAKSRATSYVEVATTQEVAQRVIDRLHLQISTDDLIRHIHVSQTPDTVSLKFRATAATPRGAQALVVAWIQALADQIVQIEDPNGTGTNSLRLSGSQAAALPRSPVSPNPTRNLLLGGILGLLGGLGYALLRSRLDRRLSDVEDLSRTFGVTVAGAIPDSRALRRNKGELIPIVVSRTREADSAQAAEAFLKIRTNLQFMDVDNPPRVIVVTSPLAGDGKSTVSANLAVSLAEAGSSVVLVDGDLRLPVVAESFGLLDGVGLTDLLTGRATFADVSQNPTASSRLTVVAAGSIPPNPSELLGSKAMRQFLESLRQDHVVIIDAPPLLPVTDAAVLTANADGALVVITAGKTLDTQLDVALSHLDAVKGHVLGVIVNKAKAAGPGSMAYYTGYSTYYGEDATKVSATKGARAGAWG